MSFFGKWKMILFGVTLIVIYALDVVHLNTDFQQQAAYVLLAFVFAHFALPVFKKYFVKKTIAFDMGGVIVKGDFFTENMTEMPGMKELLSKLKDDYKTALASNNNALAFPAFNQKFGLGSMFDYLLVSGEVGVKKPDLAYFKKLVEMTGSKPSDIIFFDDDAGNVEAAKKAGFKAVVFKNAEQCKEALKGFGIRV